MASNQNQASYHAGETKARTEKTEAAKQKAAETTEAARQKAAEATEAAKQKASETAQYTKESAVAGKDKTGSVLQQAGETVVNAVVGAKDAVANTLGMGGDNATKDTTTGATTKDTTTTTRNH
uniref:Uncharacterized protein n=1 Tax=Aegilops tauschii TaxID=37682 RepID=M8BA57_AEGTA